MNNQDLRVVKTRENIKTTFCNMLKMRPVEKISVTELSRQAKINKSTFYLHYQDIYALYNEVRDDFLQQMVESMDYCGLLFLEPEEFLNRFYETLTENAGSIDFLWPDHDIFLFQPNLNDRILNKIYNDCDIERSVRNDMILDIIIESILRLCSQYIEEEPEITREVLLKMIYAFFPKEDQAF